MSVLVLFAVLHLVCEHSDAPRSIHNCRTVQLLLLLGGVYQSLTSLTSKFSFVAWTRELSNFYFVLHRFHEVFTIGM
jgi:hypothetical protein